jgi:hypothetical protein
MTPLMCLQFQICPKDGQAGFSEITNKRFGFFLYIEPLKRESVNGYK